MKLIRHFKKSKTVKIAWLKNLGGVVTIILANLNYFESSVSAVVFGCLMIGFGILDYYIRIKTSEPL